MTRMVSIIIMFLAALAPGFGAALEGPAQGTVIVGPEVFSTTDVPSGDVPAASMPPAWQVPDWAQVRPIKRGRPTPRQDAIIRMPPPRSATVVPILARIDGLTQTQHSAPDPAMAAGLSEVLEVVNSTWAVFDKAGLKLSAGSLSSMFRRVNPPAVIYQAQTFYDSKAERWVISALGRNPAGGPPTLSVWLLAVSQQASPLGSWWVWKMDASMNGISPASSFADDQALGYNDKFVAMSANMFSLEREEYLYAKVRVFDKAMLYQGLMRTYFDFWGLKDESGRLVSSVRPMRSPEGAADFYLASVAPDSGSLLRLWQVAGTSSLASIERLPSLRIRHYDAPPDAQQPGTNVRLETGPARLQSLSYLREKLYCTFHEFYPWTGIASAGIRYLVLGVPPPVPVTSVTQINTAPAVPLSVLVDQTLGNGLVNYFNPSVVVDGRSNAYFVFNFSSSNLYPGIAYAGWRHNGRLSAPTILRSGEAPYGRTDPAPFGHVTAIALDPNADNVAWVAGAYGRKSGTWGTTMAELSFDPLRYRAGIVYDHRPVQVKSGALLKFGQTKPHWNVVGVRSQNAWNLENWDVNFTTFRARSTHDMPIVLTEFCVTDGNHSPLDTMGIKLSSPAPLATGTLQYSQSDATELDPVAVNGPFQWGPNDVVRVYDYHATPGTDTCFTLSLLDGNVDLGMAIFRSPNAPYYANRYQAVAIADANGPGEGEYLTFKPMIDDYYAVVTWSNNSERGSFSLSTACRIRGDQLQGDPDNFSLAVGSGVVGAQATITYDLPKKTSLALRVYDAQGRAVRTLAAQTHEPGRYQVTWDGRSATGRTVAAGTYFVRLESKEFTAEQKLVKVQ